MPGHDPQLGALVELLRTQAFAADLDLGAVARGRTRKELGIGSLDVILLMTTYIDETGLDIDFDPEWVALLEDVDGIIAVMGQIDATRAAEAS